MYRCTHLSVKLISRFQANESQEIWHIRKCWNGRKSAPSRVVGNVSQGEVFWKKVRIFLLLNTLRAEMIQCGPTNLCRHHRLQTDLCALHSNPDAKVKELYSMVHVKTKTISETGEMLYSYLCTWPEVKFVKKDCEATSLSDFICNHINPQVFALVLDFNGTVNPHQQYMC